MEEDIKIVKDTLNKMKKNNFIIQYKDLYIEDQIINSIENILTRLEQLERDYEIIQHEHDRLDKRNNELLKENEELQEDLDITHEANIALRIALDDVIQKSVIRDKIEELERLEKNPKEAKHYRAWYLRKIEILKEILGDE